MITKRIAGRKDGKASAAAALRYGEGLKRDKETGEFLDKSHRTRLGNFGLVDDDVYQGRDVEVMAELIDLAATEMQANCDLNIKVGADKKIAHFIISFNQTKPSEAVLRDTEDSMLSALKLAENHFATFLHDDNGYWHLHIFASRIDKLKHLGNPLWQDKTIRDRVCREIEIRHNLERDAGLHRIDEAGRIVEVPRLERQAKRDQKQGISDSARTTEKYSGEKSFQTWCNEIRVGDRLKHAKSWHELHTAAAAYNCEIKQKGAGFVICPIDEKGSIQLSKVGLKNLPAKLGAFQPARLNPTFNLGVSYIPEPTLPNASKHYQKWREAKDKFKSVKTNMVNEQREAHKQMRQELREQHKSELAKIRATTQGAERYATVSVTKMQHAVSLVDLSEQFARERKSLRQQLAAQGPRNTFREFLMNEAGKGDESALHLSQKYGAHDSSQVMREREFRKLKIVAVIAGEADRPTPRLRFPFRVEQSGSVVFELGRGRSITDNAISRQVQLNDSAANSPEAIEIALRFATSKFGNSLTLTGSQEFQRKAVEVAVSKGLNINFTDPALQTYKQQITSSINHQEKHNVTRAQPYQSQRIPPAHRRDRMHSLSEFSLVPKSKNVEVLLSQNVPDRLADRHEGRRHGDGLRRFDGNGAGRANVSTKRIRSDDIEIQPSTLSARDWALEWSQTNQIKLVDPQPGDGKVGYIVIYVDRNEVVVKKGREIACYAKTAGVDLHVGSEIVIGKNAEILLLQKSLEISKKSHER